MFCSVENQSFNNRMADDTGMQQSHNQVGVSVFDNSNEEDFELFCSDEEMLSRDGVDWEPKPEEIIELFEALESNKVLPLDWECPERRPLTPVGSFDQKYGDDVNAEELLSQSGFDFEDDSSPMKMSVRPTGSDVGPRGSAKKKTTNLDDILSNMARHRKLDMMEDNDDELPL